MQIDPDSTSTSLRPLKWDSAFLVSFGWGRFYRTDVRCALLRWRWRHCFRVTVFRCAFGLFVLVVGMLS